MRLLVGFALGAFLFLGISPCLAQQTGCNFYFAVIYHDPKFADVFIHAWPKDISKWYQKEGAAKYPHACASYQKANYVFVWFQSSEPITIDVPKVRSAFTTSTIRSANGNAVANSVTTWVEHEKETRQREFTIVTVFRTKDGKPMFDGGEIDTNYNYDSHWRGRHSAKKAFELLFDIVARVEDVKAGHLK